VALAVAAVGAEESREVGRMIDFVTKVGVAVMVWTATIGTIYAVLVWLERCEAM
jgi:hypothetical protein